MPRIRSVADTAASATAARAASIASALDRRTFLAASGGAMAAVVGVDEAAVTRMLADPTFHGLDLANHNAV
ncbi:hypothetical protein, partial [Streptomyces sp. NPDC056512]|uniref:hypothetical protein n=1 Tax=Streptomyces sp. NPDC056512 TaxID=3345846 RepID=UPI0036C151E5